MADLSKKIAKSCQKNHIFGLKGTLGAGKSFFAKNFINQLQNEKTEILSPTFNIMISYEENPKNFTMSDVPKPLYKTYQIRGETIYT